MANRKPQAGSDQTALARHLAKLEKAGQGVLCARVADTVEFSIDEVTPDIYDWLCRVATEAWIDDADDERIEQVKRAANRRVWWRPGCNWQEGHSRHGRMHKGTREGPRRGDLTEAAIERMQAYLDWIINEAVRMARRTARADTLAAYVEPVHVEKAMARLLRVAPVLDAHGDEVCRRRPR